MHLTGMKPNTLPPRSKNTGLTGEVLLGLLLIASLGQVATCFSAGRVLLAPTSHVLPVEYSSTFGTNLPASTNATGAAAKS